MKLADYLGWLKIVSLAVFLIIPVLTGCASRSGGGSAGTPQQANTQGEASASAHTALAAQYYDRGQFGVAMEELEVALQAKANYAPAFNVRGLVRMAMQEHQLAEKDFQQSLKLDSSDSDTHNNYGWFLCQQDRAAESIQHFMAALKNPLYSTPAKAYLNAGVCSKKAGKMKDAESYLQKALALQSNMREALFGLADLAYDNGDYAGAKSYFLRFSKLIEDMSAENLWLAVRIERKLGSKGTEHDYASQLRKQFPDARETQLMLYGQ